MTAAVVATVPVTSRRHREWLTIAARSPQLAATAGRYLEQIGLSLRPSSVVVADAALRMFCRYLLTNHPETDRFALVGREEIEGFKRSVAARRTRHGTPLSVNTVRTRLGIVRTFFDRIIEWDWPDAPARTPIFSHDLPVAEDPLPRFLNDAAAWSIQRRAPPIAPTGDSSRDAAPRPPAPGTPPAGSPAGRSGRRGVHLRLVPGCRAMAGAPRCPLGRS